MKLAEFFAELGWKIEGTDALQIAQKAVEDAKQKTEGLVGEMDALTKALIEADKASAKYKAGTVEGRKAAEAAEDIFEKLEKKKKEVAKAQVEEEKALVRLNKATKQQKTDLKSMAVETGKAAAAINVINAAMGVLIATAAAAGTYLEKFRLQTGLSAQQLQQWEFAAEGAGVGADQIGSAIKAIQLQQAQIAMGGGDISAFQFFGIDPREKDPFTVLQKLRDRLKEFNDDTIGYARERAAAMGVSDDLFQMLRRETLDLGGLRKELVLTQAQQKRLNDLTGAWRQLGFSLVQLKNKFAAEFAGPVLKLANALKFAVDMMARFVNWLHRGSTMALVVKGILIAIAAILGVAGAAFAALTAVLGAGAIAMGLFGGAGLDAMLALAPLIVTLGVAAAAIAAIVLVIDDVITEAEGGKSVLGDFFEVFHQPVDLMAAAMENLLAIFDLLIGKFSDAKGHFQSMVADMENAMPKWMRKLFGIKTEVSAKTDAGQKSAAAQAAVPALPNMPQLTAAAATPATTHTIINQDQSKDVSIRIDGAQSPKETAREVKKAVNEPVSSAYYQRPARNY